MRLSIDFNQIVVLDGSQDYGFEELVCQLARHEFGHLGEFRRVNGAGGDGGVEAYVVLPDKSEWGWQAKFYPTGKLDRSRRNQIKKSLDQTRKVHPNCKVWYLAIPTDLNDETSRKGHTERAWWDMLRSTYAKLGMDLRLWDKSTLIDLLTKSENRGRLLYWFGALTLSHDWFQRQLVKRLAALQSKYIREIHVQTHVDSVLTCACAGPRPLEDLRKNVCDYAVSVYYATNAALQHLPEADSLEIRDVAHLFEKCSGTVEYLLDSLVQFCNSPIDQQQLEQVSRLINRYHAIFASYATSFVRRVLAIRDRSDFGVINEVADLVKERYDWHEGDRPEFKVDPALDDLLEESAPAYWALNRAMPYISGGLSSLHLVQIDLPDPDPLAGLDEMERLIAHLYESEDEQPSGTDLNLDVLDLDLDPDELGEDTDLSDLFKGVAEDTDEEGSSQEVLTTLLEQCSSLIDESWLGPSRRLVIEEFRSYLERISSALNQLSSGFVAARRTTVVLAPPGTGKTHLFADVTRNLVESGRPALLLTGDLFSTDRTIEQTILESVGLNGYNWDDFLRALAVAAETTRSNALILIDAINESSSVKTWRSSLASFQADLAKTDGVVLALSCRSTYVESIWGKKAPADSIRLEHSNLTMSEMTRRYFAAHRLQGLSHDTVSLFSSPLYLRLYCVAFGSTDPKKPIIAVSGKESIFDVFEQFLDRAAENVAHRCDKDPSAIRKLVKPIADLFWNSPELFVPWDAVTEVIQKRFGTEPSWENSVSRAVLSEELLLRREVDGQDSDITLFAYDLLGDYLVGWYGMLGRGTWDRSLLDRVPWDTMLSHPRGPGLVDFLAMAIPRYCDGWHLWQVCPQEPQLTKASLRVLPMLATSLVRNEDVQFVEDCLSEYPALVLRTMFECALIPGHPIGPERLYRVIRQIGVQRWRQWVHKNEDLVDRLVARLKKVKAGNLAILCWMVYDANRRKDLLDLVVDYTGSFPEDVPKLKEYDLSEDAEG